MKVCVSSQRKQKYTELLGKGKLNMKLVVEGSSFDSFCLFAATNEAVMLYINF